MYSLLKNWLFAFFLLIICFFAVACANLSKAPGGGPIDEKFPECRSFYPKNYSSKLSVYPPPMVFTFDEFIKIKDYDKFLSSPPLSNVKYQVKLKELHIYISDTLKPEMTYSLNLSGAISDITEENVQNQLHYVFSTGSVIDTLFIDGMVKDAWTGEGVFGLHIGLYTSLPDTFPFQEKPLYLAKTDSSGYFKAEYLKEGCYRIFVFEDGNKNLIPDPLDERLAYSYSCIPTVSFVDSGKSAERESLLLHNNRIPKIFLKESKLNKPGNIHLDFYYPLDSLSFSFFKRDTLINTKSSVLWAEDRMQLSLRYDSIFLRDFSLVLRYGIYTDTVDFLYTGEVKKADALKVNYTPAIQPRDPIILSFSNPIQKYFRDSILYCTEVLGKDTQLLQCRLNPIDEWRAQIALNFKEGASYNLCVQKAVVQDIYGQYNDSTQISWKTDIKESYGLLRLKIKGMKKNHDYILDFIDDQKKLIRKEFINSSDSNLVFSYMKPANYSFRLIEDANKNRYWDQASYMEKTVTEKVFYFPKLIKIEADWEFEEEWLLPNE